MGSERSIEALPVLRVEELTVRFHTPDGVVRAVEGVSFHLDRAQTLAIVGESGSGKTATGLAIMRLLQTPPARIEGGDVAFRGHSLLKLSDEQMRKVRGDRIAMVFQDPMNSLNPVVRIGSQLTEALTAHQPLSRDTARVHACELLELVGIPDASRRMDEYPHQLSGGMRQRVLIAMAIANDPDVLIADEPTTALDVTIQAQVLELLKDLQARTGMAIVVITHDLGVVADIADEVLVMYAGRPMEKGPASHVFGAPLHPYTWGLLDSVRGVGSAMRGALCAVEGQPPSPLRLPSGCVFHPRCPHARDICATDVPALRSIAAGHGAACHFAGDDGFAWAGCAVSAVNRRD